MTEQLQPEQQPQQQPASYTADTTNTKNTSSSAANSNLFSKGLFAVVNHNDSSSKSKSKSKSNDDEYSWKLREEPPLLRRQCDRSSSSSGSSSSSHTSPASSRSMRAAKATNTSKTTARTESTATTSSTTCTSSAASASGNSSLPQQATVSESLTTPLLSSSAPLQQATQNAKQEMKWPPSNVRPSLFQSWNNVFSISNTGTTSSGTNKHTSDPKTNNSNGQATPTTAASDDDLDDLELVGRFLRRGTLVAWTLWITLLFLTVRCAPASSFQHLTPGEAKSTSVMVILLLVTNGSRLLPLAMQHSNSLQFLQSGILTGSFSVQCMALVSNLGMLVLPTPIMIDPMTGMRIHLVRFAAWVPLCFLMTFLTEAIDIPLNRHQNNNNNKKKRDDSASRIAWWHASALGLSTFAGWLFPFCTSSLAWWTTMVVSWVLFGALYVRLYQRYQRYKYLKRRHERALLHAKHQQYNNNNKQQQQQQSHKRRSKTGPSWQSSYTNSNTPRRASHRSINAIKEQMDRAHFSLQLIVLCTISWTFIAVAFTLECFLPNLVATDSIWASSDLPLITGHVLESLSKVWYLSLQLNVYDKIFDESNRAVRRLEELRTLMSALWEASSDIMVICARTDNIIHAVVSPNALLQNPSFDSDDEEEGSDDDDDDDQVNDDDSAFSLSASLSSLHGSFHHAMLESSMSIMLEIVPQTGTFCSFPIDLSKPVTRVDASTIQQARNASPKQFGRINGYPHMLQGTAVEKNLATIAHLAYQVCESKLSLDDDQLQEDTSSYPSQGANQTTSTNNSAGSTEEEPWMLQDLYATSVETSSNRSLQIKCEAKVTPIDAGALLLVLRDVSERYERFEVEKQLLKEVIVRKKDAEAIRFTRHEVKNGLVAAIGLVDSFKEAYEKQRAQLEELKKWKEQQLMASQDQQKQESSGDDLDSYVTDLDSTLRQVLDTILDNAMTREILFEGYVPRRESVDLPELLHTSLKTRNSSGHSASQGGRFPIVATPESFPHLTTDPQLLRNIYQHAVSNACKYGKADGDVKTILSYDHATETFRLEISNLPGYNHARLVALSQEEVDCVFTEGTQLRINQCLDTVEGKLASARSAGDGAYVMRKGAECLGGKCEILFEETGTTFSFTCPATVCENWLEKNRATDASSATKGPFALPESTWAIVVEDSAMQHKLLDRFLKKAGIANDRLIALGKTSQEILQFTEKIREALQEHPEDKFLMIIDENLDVVEGGAVTKTVSGSFTIQLLLKALPPHDESRVLALIRSANDSVQEVELYQSRAHGFLLKGPIKKGGLLDEIKPWWIRRFMSSPPQAGSRAGHDKGPRRSSSLTDSSSTYDDDLGLARERITDLSREIDTLCNVDADASSVSSNENDENDSESGSHDGLPPPPRRMSVASSFMDWPSIRYKLMLLNVDLKTHLNRDNFALAAKSIDEITNSSTSCFLPQDLQGCWLEIRDLIFRELSQKNTAK